MLVRELPLLRRIRLALAILRETEPDQIPVEEMEDDLMPPGYQGEEALAKRILSRKESYLRGEGVNISRAELMEKIYSELNQNQ